MSKGIVVDHRESRVRYAISDKNFNEDVHKYIRDLGPGESVIGFRPRPVKRLGEAEPPQEELASTGATATAAGDAEVGSGDSQQTPSSGDTGTKTEGASTGTQEKEGK